QKRQMENNWNQSDSGYYMYHTRELQENEMLPTRIGFRQNIKALLVVYVQKFDDSWTSTKRQEWITAENHFVVLPEEAKGGRKHMIVLIVYPLDVTLFNRILKENRGNIGGLLEVRFS